VQPDVNNTVCNGITFLTQPATPFHANVAFHRMLSLRHLSRTNYARIHIKSNVLNAGYAENSGEANFSSRSFYTLQIN